MTAYRTRHPWAIAFTLLALSCSLLTLACTGRLGPEPTDDEPGSAANLQCGGTSTLCGAACVETLSDDQHCGDCDSPCEAGNYCSAGNSVPLCVEGEAECSEGCEVITSDRAHCGGCGNACNLAYCDQGLCSAECSGVTCPDAGGEQVCVHLDQHPDHCGQCGNACPVGNSCVDGLCVKACPSGRKLCDDACVDVRSSTQHCGNCGTPCAEGVECVQGSCGGQACPNGVCECGTDTKECDGACISLEDFKTNSSHCGDCGVTCSDNERCEEGGCVCKEGLDACTTGCTDTKSDDENCGGCGMACTGGKTCEEGICECAADKTACGDSCVDTQTDAEHCGGCDSACESYEQCKEGLCKYEEDDCGGEAVLANISRIALYQGVETELFDGQTAVMANNRAVDVIAGREAMVRVFVETSPGFSPRELSARLFLDNGEDTKVFFAKKRIMGSSKQEALDSTFNIEVPAEAITVDSEYRVEMVECGAAPVGEVGLVRHPEDALQALDAVETGIIEIAFVPITHDGRSPDVSETRLAAYAADIQKQYPTTEVQITVAPEITSGQTGVGIDIIALLDRVTEHRGEYSPESQVYLYGLIDPADDFATYCNYFGNNGCTTGVAWVLNELGNGVADYRPGVGVGFGNFGVTTLTHELGHNHGQYHAPCGIVDNPNDPTDVDPSYPYPGASIGVWGYDLDATALKDPDEFVDFMGYCNPSWVSDYAYNRYADRITALNRPGAGAFSTASDAATRDVRWERMLVTGTGARWLKGIMGPSHFSSSARLGVVYSETGAVVAQVDVYPIYLSENLGYVLHVPPAQPGWYAVGLQGEVALPY